MILVMDRKELRAVVKLVKTAESDAMAIGGVVPEEHIDRITDQLMEDFEKAKQIMAILNMRMT